MCSTDSVEIDAEMTPRVNGCLAMTRCFGNFDLKLFSVIAVPEIQMLIRRQCNCHTSAVQVVCDKV